MESDTPTTPTTAAAAAKAAPKESKWNDAAHVALLGSVVEALHESGSSPAKNKDLIMKTMTAQGQDFTWEAIRDPVNRSLAHISSPSSLFFLIFLPLPDLLVAFYSAFQQGMEKDKQDAIVATMRAKGHDDVNWDLLRWEDIRDDLFEAIMNVHGPLTKEQQDDVVEFMRSRGHITLASITIFIMSRPVHVWDAEANHDVLIALNKLFLPNAKDCEKMIVELRAKGYTYTTMPAAGRVLQTWTAETHEAIMLVMVEYLKPSAKQWREMLEMLHSRGHTFTEGALQYVQQLLVSLTYRSTLLGVCSQLRLRSEVKVKSQ
ncbi:hypothetical protein B0T19DRAFT_466163 [Cercophora scortea]|uniref:Uncharacterized protein n=1 Tax=Cercophora scortea TaxID=314031 RepID=A0AAE0I9G2_9PEZI|nr:hypothetical protein B0T19DRAFT_466163 [Cercophora scortea]